MIFFPFLKVLIGCKTFSLWSKLSYLVNSTPLTLMVLIAHPLFNFVPPNFTKLNYYFLFISFLFVNENLFCWTCTIAFIWTQVTGRLGCRMLRVQISEGQYYLKIFDCLHNLFSVINSKKLGLSYFQLSLSRLSISGKLSILWYGQ